MTLVLTEQEADFLKHILRYEFGTDWYSSSSMHLMAKLLAKLENHDI